MEEVDLMFKIKYHAGKGMSYKEAGKLAKKEADSVRSNATRQEASLSDGKQDVREEEEVFAAERKY